MLEGLLVDSVGATGRNEVDVGGSLACIRIQPRQIVLLCCEFESHMLLILLQVPTVFPHSIYRIISLVDSHLIQTH